MEQYGQEAVTPFDYVRPYIEHEGMEVYAVADLRVDHDREEYSDQEYSSHDDAAEDQDSSSSMH